MLRRISFVFLLLVSLAANALTFSDIKFGNKQFGDAQWNATACMTTTTCTSSGQNVGVLKYGSATITPGSTQYLQFVYTNTDTTRPWSLRVYNSNGTLASTIGNIRIINAGQGYFMISDASSGAGHGSLWSTQSGMVTGSKTFTEILNPTQAQMDAYANSYYSPDPIYVAGQTYSPPQLYSSGITTTQQTSKTTNTTLRQSQTGNAIYVEQIGDNNNITLRQGQSLTGKNRMSVYSNGNGNTINLNQGYNTDGTVSANDSNNHYMYLHLSGNTNSVISKQTDGNTSSVGHYNETTVSGNSNIVNSQQQGTGSKTLFLNVNGGSNTVTTNQQDGGQHYLDVKLTGNGHNVNTTQSGTGNHAATIDLTNSGGASSVTLTQSGSTAQVYSIQQSCTNPSGCSTVITQP